MLFNRTRDALLRKGAYNKTLTETRRTPFSDYVPGGGTPFMFRGLEAGPDAAVYPGQQPAVPQTPAPQTPRAAVQPAQQPRPAAPGQQAAAPAPQGRLPEAPGGGNFRGVYAPPSAAPAPAPLPWDWPIAGPGVATGGGTADQDSPLYVPPASVQMMARREPIAPQPAAQPAGAFTGDAYQAPPLPQVGQDRMAQALLTPEQLATHRLDVQRSAQDRQYAQPVESDPALLARTRERFPMTEAGLQTYEDEIRLSKITGKPIGRATAVASVSGAPQDVKDEVMAQERGYRVPEGEPGRGSGRMDLPLQFTRERQANPALEQAEAAYKPYLRQGIKDARGIINATAPLYDQLDQAQATGDTTGAARIEARIEQARAQYEARLHAMGRTDADVGRNFARETPGAQAARRERLAGAGADVARQQDIRAREGMTKTAELQPEMEAQRVRAAAAQAEHTETTTNKLKQQMFADKAMEPIVRQAAQAALDRFTTETGHLQKTFDVTLAQLKLEHLQENRETELGLKMKQVGLNTAIDAYESAGQAGKYAAGLDLLDRLQAAYATAAKDTDPKVAKQFSDLLVQMFGVDVERLVGGRGAGGGGAPGSPGTKPPRSPDTKPPRWSDTLE